MLYQPLSLSHSRSQCPAGRKIFVWLLSLLFGVSAVAYVIGSKLEFPLVKRWEQQDSGFNDEVAGRRAWIHFLDLTKKKRMLELAHITLASWQRTFSDWKGSEKEGVPPLDVVVFTIATETRSLMKTACSLNIQKDFDMIWQHYGCEFVALSNLDDVNMEEWLLNIAARRYQGYTKWLDQPTDLLRHQLRKALQATFERRSDVQALAQRMQRQVKPKCWVIGGVPESDVVSQTVKYHFTRSFSMLRLPVTAALLNNVYTMLVRADSDIIMAPSMRQTHLDVPRTVVASGGYSTGSNRTTSTALLLKQTAKHLGLRYPRDDELKRVSGSFGDLAFSWFGHSLEVTLLGIVTHDMSLRLLVDPAIFPRQRASSWYSPGICRDEEHREKLKRKEEVGALLDVSDWPTWHAGVATLYASHLAVLHLYNNTRDSVLLDDLKLPSVHEANARLLKHAKLGPGNHVLVTGRIDGRAGSSSTAPIRTAVGLHCFHTDSDLSKFKLFDGRYDDLAENFTEIDPPSDADLNRTMSEYATMVALHSLAIARGYSKPTPF